MIKLQLTRRWFEAVVPGSGSGYKVSGGDAKDSALYPPPVATTTCTSTTRSWRTPPPAPFSFG